MWTSKYKMWIDFEMRQKGVLKHRIIDIDHNHDPYWFEMELSRLGIVNCVPSTYQIYSKLFDNSTISTTFLKVDILNFRFYDDFDFDDIDFLSTDQCLLQQIKTV